MTRYVTEGATFAMAAAAVGVRQNVPEALHILPKSTEEITVIHCRQAALESR